MNNDPVHEGLIEIGRRYLEHAPNDFPPPAEGLVGWNGNGVDVCAECAGRIMARGCDMKKIADIPVWEPNTVLCDLCPVEPKKVTTRKPPPR